MTAEHKISYCISIIIYLFYRRMKIKAMWLTHISKYFLFFFNFNWILQPQVWEKQFLNLRRICYTQHSKTEQACNHCKGDEWPGTRLPPKQPHTPSLVESSLSASRTASVQELSDMTESQLEMQQGRTRNLLANISWSNSTADSFTVT